MNKLAKLISSILLSLLFFSFPSQTFAATFRSGDNITITESVKDLYVAGETVTVDSNIQNDLTIAGGTVRVDGDVANSILGAGGTVTVAGAIGNTARIAGGTVNIEGPIRNDLVVAGGTVSIADSARIDGDLVITGGTLRINGPVRGNVNVHGGKVEINNTIGGSVWGGEVENLRLGPRAVVNGDLNYTSEDRAEIADGAVVRGKQNFRQEDRDDAAEKGALTGLLTGATIYKLLTAIIISLFFIWLLPRFFRRSSELIAVRPLETGILGFVTLIVMPILSFILLVFLWLGVASLLLYFFLLLASVILVYIFTGWFILRWWYGRDNRAYLLDWKAGVVGPIVVTILWFIPIIGWFINFLLWLLALGALIQQLWDFVTLNRDNGDRGVIRESRPASRPALASNRSSSRPARTSARRKR